MNQLGNTIDIASEVVDVLALVDSSRDPIYRFVGIDIRHIRAAPLKVMQQLKTDGLILLFGPLSIAVEYGEKTVECGLSENPFTFALSWGDSRFEHFQNSNNFRGLLTLRTPS
jgi:hypothetical protein